MSEARLEITVGSAKFVAEGTETWLSEVFDKFRKDLQESPALTQASSVDGDVPSDSSKPDVKNSSTLPKFLQDTTSTNNQVRKFLATAVWLQDRSDGAEVKTAEVSKSLRDSRQGKLTNASDALNQNVGKGFCEKTPSGFFVTEEGRSSLK